MKRFTEDKTVIDLSILQMSQSVNESVLDYLSKLQKSAVLNEKVDENVLLAIAINGLRPEIRRIVINKEPKNFAELRHHSATIAETSVSVPENTIQTLHETMVSEIQTLKEQLNLITTSMRQNNVTSTHTLKILSITWSMMMKSAIIHNTFLHHILITDTFRHIILALR